MRTAYPVINTHTSIFIILHLDTDV